MSNSFRLQHPIKIGSKMKSIKTKKVDTTKIFDENKCVLHLIDTSEYTGYYKDELNIDDDDDNYVKADIINKIITDQHIELWRMMKRGDLIEDLNQSGYRSNGRYFVDENKNNSIDIIRYGLIVKDLDVGFDKCRVLPNIINTITDFPPGYFDDINLIVNDHICPGEKSKSNWRFDHCEIYLDTKKLKLNKLNKDDNIFHSTKKILGTEFVKHYLYIVFTYKKNSYLLYGMYSNEIIKQNINQEKNKIIRRLVNDKIFYPNDIDDEIIKIGEHENVNKQNILNIF